MTLSATPLDRVRALFRYRPKHSARLRRLLAGALALLAITLGFWPDPGHRVVTAARDLPPGIVLSLNDLTVVSFNNAIVGSFNNPAMLQGRLLNNPTRQGEPITDVRLGPAEPDLAAVPVKLADESVAGLVRPGNRVDVIAQDGQVLAENAAVRETRDRVVVVALPRRNATRLAALSLEQPVAVTLR
ncbi:hypothetical protein Lesp02_66530 [Lentzea sp. NBRC 105346]|uniref:SAF domain-containing protein n=1 Tax=Lentzea sp. NBRC 105346 TaxID=3032205 RepID=UPI0024A0B28B|nr:SAF domain-containing protein [Lentzea sp. NBRC 105346]GLZ34466.1 hypothetical protein Lesp02_66530 [Lentzea sp. NBRC 105346]